MFPTIPLPSACARCVKLLAVRLRVRKSTLHIPLQLQARCHLLSRSHYTMADIRLPCPVNLVTSEAGFGDYDGVVVVSYSIEALTGNLEFVGTAVAAAAELDNSVRSKPSLVAVPSPLNRAIYAPTGPLNRDFDDVRRFGEAANAGIKRALEAGFKKPLLATVPHLYADASLVSLLGALHALYVPIEVREDVPERRQKVEALGVWSEDAVAGQRLVDVGTAIESGRLVYRDIGGSDPERMAAPNVANYVTELFAGSPVTAEVVSDLPTLEANYPLFAAVNRCANKVERHQGRLIKLEYNGGANTDTTLLLVGKGVTYDTGGADVKAGGHMAGMHRDKCGAAFVAGFFQTLRLLKPPNIKVIGRMAMVRNSIGVESYVADEIITSRAGVRVRVGNTDAEGRMAMADSLCEMKELARSETNPHIFTIATLTGHAIIAMGPHYSIVMDNGPARTINFAQDIQRFGHGIGDPFEISSIRREDYEFAAGKSEYEDVLQSNNQPSSVTPRGHQFPAAFLIKASGLDVHGVDSSQQLKYTHVDIAGSSGPFPGTPTGAPIPAFAAKYLM